MLQNNINTLGTHFLTIAIAATAPIIPLNAATSSALPVRNIAAYEQVYKSGNPLINYIHSSDMYVRTQVSENRIESKFIEMQSRFQAMKRSFLRYSDGFPTEKHNYFAQMADALCQLEVKSNVFSYNKADASIDTVLHLKNGLTLSVSCFIDDDIDSPMVFSIHRGRTLLVSDELPVSEIVNTLNAVTV